MASILLVEDELEVSDYLRDYFQLHGLEVHCAPSGEQGLELLSSRRPDLVLLDMRLGAGMNGLEFLRRARAAKASSPIIVVTAVDDHNVAELAKGLGAADYVTKPLMVDELERVVLSRLRRTEGSRQ